ncbi:MAG TPA: DUF1015 family protein [Jatrophihabitans sp.]|nr:DUF1015 family protein [Jatrophihabitans sp.]
MDAQPAFLHPITAGWRATAGSVGGPNYDEFVDDQAIAAALARRPASVVGLDLPNHTVRALEEGLDFAASLPLAVEQLARMKEDGLYEPVTDALFGYEMAEPDGHLVRALIGLVRVGEFSDSEDQPGRILRNEDVTASKVAERRQHIDALGHLLSTVLLVPARDQQAYDELLASAFSTLPDEPLIADLDERGVRHRLWQLDGEPFRSYLDGNAYLVADGNHRSRASQQSGSDWCLVTVASAGALRIEPYHRLLRSPELDSAQLRERIAGAGLDLTEIDPPDAAEQSTAAEQSMAAEQSDNLLYLGDGRWYRLDLPAPDGGRVVDALPHSVVERRIFTDVLGLDPAAKEISYVGGRASRDYLIEEVDAGRATAAFLLRPVTMAEFTAINAARQYMPRKSTWFMPKARAGLVLAEIR